MIRPVPMAADKNDNLSHYLRSLGLLALEVADRPQLLPLFLEILQLVPRTIAAMLARERRRIAA